MPKRIADKMGVKSGMKAYFRNAPDEALLAIDLPDLCIAKSMRGSFDYMHLFAITSKELDRELPRLKKHLKPGGRLFVSWPKSRQQESDLTLPEVIRIGYSHGLVESTALSINQTWPALKFTWPKPGKIYRNSYGQLPVQPTHSLRRTASPPTEIDL